MRRLLMITMLLAPVAASADHLDVIQAKLKEGCTLDKYVTLKKDFTEQWGNSHGYRISTQSHGPRRRLALAARGATSRRTPDCNLMASGLKRFGFH